LEYAGKISPQLTEENIRQLSEARKSSAKIRRGVFVARFDGYTVGFFGAVTFLGSLVMGLEWSGIAIGTALVIVAYVELDNAKRLSRLEPIAVRNLAINQLGLAGAMVIYALWSLFAITHGTTGAGEDPEVANLMSEYGPMVRQLEMLVYYCLIAVAIFFQGGLALYYSRLQKHIDVYVNETPEWIRQMNQAGHGI
jgi:hypothetical protein